MARVLILGAGISGLTVAYRLQQLLPAADITVLEARDRPGGTIWTARQDGFQVEIGPNGFLDNKPTTVQLCRDLGLGERLVAAGDAAAKNRYLLVDGHLKKLPGGLISFLGSDLLTWRGKVALLMERWRKPPPWQGRETLPQHAVTLPPQDESVHDFAVRRAGPEVADVFADALVTGIHAGDPKLLSIQAAFPRVAALEREFGSVSKGFSLAAKKRRQDAKASGQPPPQRSRMWSFQDGLRLLVETLSSQLRLRPILGVQVQRVAKGENQKSRQWVASASSEENWTADAVVLACPAYCQAALLADLDSGLANKIADIPYNRVAVVALGYRQADVPMSLDGFGYIAPQRSSRDLLGVQWCSSIFPGRAPPGAVLLRAMCGGWNRPDIAGWDDDKLLTAVRAELRLAMGIQAQPIFHHITRWDRAIPQYHVGHLERVAQIEARAAGYPGLFLTGNAYRGVALNDCVEQGGITADRVANFLSTIAGV